MHGNKRRPKWRKSRAERKSQLLNSEKNREFLAVTGLISRHRRQSSLKDLESVTSNFGCKQFDVDSYIEDTYKLLEAGEVDGVKQQLERKQAATIKKLQEIVGYHYGDFVDATSRIRKIESGMAKTLEFVEGYKNLLSTLRGIRFFDSGLGEFDDGEEEKALGEGKENSTDIHVLKTIQVYDAELEALQSTLSYNALASKLRELEELVAGSEFGERCVKERKKVIVDSIIENLSNSRLQSSQRKRQVSLLISLGYPYRALSILLDLCSRETKKSLEQVPPNDHEEIFIATVTQVFFEKSNATISQFKSIVSAKRGIQTEMKGDDSDRDMDNYEHYSRLVVWFSEELEAYASLFKQRVFEGKVSEQTVVTCCDAAFSGCELLEGGFQIQAKVELARNFEKGVQQTILESFRLPFRRVVSFMETEPWKSRRRCVVSTMTSPKSNHSPRLEVEHLSLPNREQRFAPSSGDSSIRSDFFASSHRGGGFEHRRSGLIQSEEVFGKFSQSCGELFDMCQSCTLTASSLGEIEELKDIVLPLALEQTAKLVNVYVTRFTRFFKEECKEKEQQLAMIANVEFIDQEIVPRVAMQYLPLYSDRVSEWLEMLSLKLKKLLTELKLHFANVQLPSMIELVGWAAESKIYDIESFNLPKAIPTTGFVSIIKFIAELQDLILQNCSPRLVSEMLIKVVDVFLQHIAQSRFCPPIRSTNSGLNQLALDLAFFQVSLSSTYLDHQSGPERLFAVLLKAKQRSVDVKLADSQEVFERAQAYASENCLEILSLPPNLTNEKET